MKLKLDDKEYPAVYELCHRCEGHGVHDHSAFSNGLSAEDLNEDPEFKEEYFSGMYDVTCSVCKGKRVVAVIDWDRLTPEETKEAESFYHEEAMHDAEIEAERRMGC